MAIVTQTVHSAHPVSLPSPTLTNPDMILPDFDRNDSPSPTPLPDRPPSPSALIRQISPQPGSIKLANAPQGRRSISPRTMTSTPRPLPNINELDPRRRADDAASATYSLRSKSSASTINTWRPSQNSGMATSNGSASPRSDEMDTARWPGFDSVANSGAPHQEPVGDVGDQEDEEEDDHPGPLPESVSVNGDDDLDNDRWLDSQEDGDSDIYEHNALSRRAEIILANAKKRLTLMEGNLRGARHSMLPPAYSHNSLLKGSDFSSNRERDSKLSNRPIQFMASRQRSHYSTSLSPINSSGHSRILSETFTPGSLPGGSIKKIHLSEKRASSALGPMTASWSPVEQLHFSRSASISRGIRASRSQEQMRNDRIVSWQAQTIEEHPLRRVSPPSSGGGLERLPEHEAAPSPAGLQRSGSTTTDLRAQMNELKGRISSLQNRAREESMRRRSLQNLRTPSPFTQAEAWYAGADGYNGRSAPTDAGFGSRVDVEDASDARLETTDHPKSASPTQLNAQDLQAPRDSVRHVSSPRSNPTPVEYAESSYEDAPEATEEATESAFEAADRDHAQYMEEGYDMHNPQHQEAGEQQEDGIEDYGDDDYAVDDASLSEHDSVYMEPEYIPIAERHEDRADAFDYEHFFLHSAMGTYRRGSVSSEDSVETTRPLSPVRQQSPDVRSPTRPFHHRNESASSVSSVDTFQTATEGRDSDVSDDESAVDLDEITQQIIDHNLHSIQRHHSQRGLHASALNADRADSAVVMPERRRSPEKDVKYSAAQRVVQILIDSTSEASPELSQTDKDMIYALAVSLEQACVNLRNLAGDDYDKRLWRRRLDDARRMLDGEGEGEAF